LPLPKPAITAEGSVAAQQLRTQAVQLADHLAVRHDDLTHREAELNVRAAELESGLRNARAWLRQREEDIERLRQQWLDERHRAQAELEAVRRRLDREHRCDWADLQAKRAALERRAEEVDRAWAALRQVHEEVARAHRESLELRLANEELRAELGLLVPVEVREQTVAQIRARLSEEYRRENELLSRQKRELAAIRNDLAKQHRRLARERERLHRIAAQVAAQRTGVHRAE
jgi:chromosome segregation ATPase